MPFSNRFNHNLQKKNSRRLSIPAVLISLLLTGALLSGCSGTGTMYTPDSFEESSEDSATADTAAAEVSDTASAPLSGDESGRHGKEGPDQGNQDSAEMSSEEDPRTLRADLEGAGSDLYTVQAVASYYEFTLDDVSFSLPSRLSAFEQAGWQLLFPETENASAEQMVIPSYSFEYVDAGSADGKKKIRLCLANFTENDLAAASCTVCGIIVTDEDGAMLKTTFGAGIGDSIDDLTAVFGKDSSVYTKTKYSDGTCTLHYHFANGLNEGETIPVLAEAEDKSLAELILAETAADGKTIRSLSMFFFRLPQ